MRKQVPEELQDARMGIWQRGDASVEGYGGYRTLNPSRGDLIFEHKGEGRGREKPPSYERRHRLEGGAVLPYPGGGHIMDKRGREKGKLDGRRGRAK